MGILSYCLDFVHANIALVHKSRKTRKERFRSGISSEKVYKLKGTSTTFMTTQICNLLDTNYAVTSTKHFEKSYVFPHNYMYNPSAFSSETLSKVVQNVNVNKLHKLCQN